MGATLAFWLGALEPRVRAVAQLCVLADIACLIASGAHDRHAPYLTVPGLVPFLSTGSIAGLVAPRPQLVCLGSDDPLTPQEAREKAIADARACYVRVPSGENLHVFIEPDTGHRETLAMREKVLAFLSSAF
jgi:hypothetical protein